MGDGFFISRFTRGVLVNEAGTGIVNDGSILRAQFEFIGIVDLANRYCRRLGDEGLLHHH